MVRVFSISLQMISNGVLNSVEGDISIQTPVKDSIGIGPHVLIKRPPIHYDSVTAAILEYQYELFRKDAIDLKFKLLANDASASRLSTRYRASSSIGESIAEIEIKDAIRLLRHEVQTIKQINSRASQYNNLLNYLE